MKKWGFNKLLNGIRTTTILSMFLIAALYLRINKMNLVAIDSVLLGLFILLILQGFMIDSIIKKLKNNS